jgi:intracellular multiplication protein IcmQ
MTKSDKEREKKLLELVRDALEQDKNLREKYKVGDKFRFIRDRLQALATRLEEQVMAAEQKIKKAEKQSPDDRLVYVYLYNAQGMLFPTWQKMVTAAVLYEYSVNRPIYADKLLVETYIRSKASKAQHAYLTVAVKPLDILAAPGAETAKDALGSSLVKVREGSLLVNKLVLFTHNGHEYTLSETGVLTKKQD